MRTSIYMLFCFWGLFPFLSHAQSDSLPLEEKECNVQHELSIDATTLLRQFFSGDSIDFESPYFLTYKYIMGNRAIRFGIGGAFDRSDQSNEAFADSRLDQSQQLDIRLGYELRSSLGGKWLGYFGMDVVGQFGQRKTILDSGIDVITNKVNTIGGGIGPAIGLQFYLTDRLSISTEGSFYYVFLQEKTFELFENFPQFNDDVRINDRQELKINLPSTIYLNYTF